MNIGYLLIAAMILVGTALNVLFIYLYSQQFTCTVCRWVFRIGKFLATSLPQLDCDADSIESTT